MIRALGPLDVGQAVIVQQGLVLGIEAIEGTDALIERCGALRRDGPGGVLVKMTKPTQDLRFDLPTVGVVTVERCAAAGLRGIAIEAGKTIALDREAIARSRRPAWSFRRWIGHYSVNSGTGPLVFLIAGEPSGDLLGARLMAAMKRKSTGPIRFAGIGGDRMIAEGLESAVSAS